MDLPGLEETDFFGDYPGACIVSLDSNERIAEEAAWLEGVLGSSSSRTRADPIS